MFGDADPGKRTFKAARTLLTMMAPSTSKRPASRLPCAGLTVSVEPEKHPQKCPARRPSWPAGGLSPRIVGAPTTCRDRQFTRQFGNSTGNSQAILGNSDPNPAIQGPATPLKRESGGNSRPRQFALLKF